MVTVSELLSNLCWVDCEDSRRRGSQVLVNHGLLHTIIPGHPEANVPAVVIERVFRDLKLARSPRTSIPSSHRAVFEFDQSDAVWLVEFPSLAGCHTYGETLDEARTNALEALQVWLDEDEASVEEDIRPSTAAAG